MVSSQPKEFFVPRSDVIDDTIRYLVRFYENFAFYRRRIPEYLCGLAARYATHTMFESSSPTMLLSHSLWLSLVWVIDGMIDSGRLKNLRRIIRLVRTEKHIPSPDIFEELVDGAYHHYLDLSRSSRDQNPDAHRRIRRWLLRYLRCQGSVPGDHKAYRHHRLKDGGMMCVMWHMVMYSGIRPNKELRRAFADVSLIVSFQNDLLSFDRDRRQNTPNLLDHMGDGGPWDRFTRGVACIDRLHDRLSKRRLSEEGKKICDHVVIGSHNWSIKESRYRIGVQLLRSWENDDRATFEALLVEEIHADGDPIPSPV